MERAKGLKILKAMREFEGRRDEASIANIQQDRAIRTSEEVAAGNPEYAARNLTIAPEHSYRGDDYNEAVKRTGRH